MFHYHIRWSDSKPDWQAFKALEEALREAKRLVRRGETYTIEGFDDDCIACAGLFVRVHEESLRGEQIRGRSCVTVAEAQDA